MIKVSSQAFNNETLKHFNQLVYKGVITPEMRKGNEIAVNLGDDNKHPGYLFQKDHKTFFVKSEFYKDMPIRTKESKRVLQGSNVYHAVTSYAKIKVEPQKVLKFRSLVDGFCNFEHSRPDHFLLWKLTCLAAYISRVNYRLATPASFGKDGVIDALKALTNDCVRIDNATFAKLEYFLRYPYIVCNEVASLKPEEQRDFESFGLSAGAFQTMYAKKSRKTHATQEEYDISGLSLGFTFNTKDYYEKIGRNGFDAVFPKQFLDRFLPLKMRGVLEVDQFKVEAISFEEECESNMDFYKGLVKTLLWYRENPLKLTKSFGLKGMSSGRHRRSFRTVLACIQEYSKDNDEFEELGGELLKCYERYNKEETDQIIKSKGAGGQSSLAVETETI